MRLMTAWIVIVCWSEALSLAAWWFHSYFLMGVFLVYPLLISVAIENELPRRRTRRDRGEE